MIKWFAVFLVAYSQVIMISDAIVCTPFRWKRNWYARNEWLINFARRRPARSKQQSFFWIKTYCILMNAGETYSQWFLKRIGRRMDEKFRMWFYESWSRLCGLGNSLNLWMIYLTENFAYFMLRKPFKKMRKFVVAMMTSNADEIECHSVTWDEKVVDAQGWAPSDADVSCCMSEETPEIYQCF